MTNIKTTIPKFNESPKTTYKTVSKSNENNLQNPTKTYGSYVNQKKDSITAQPTNHSSCQPLLDNEAQAITINSKKQTLLNFIHSLLNSIVKYEYREPIESLLEFDNANHLIDYLNSNQDNGLNETDVKRNRDEFGANDLVGYQSTPCYEFFLTPLYDPMIIVLIIAAILSIPIGLYDHDWDIKGALEGVAILTAVVVVVIVTAWNDWAKEQEFKKLQAVYDHSQSFIVVRGGKECTVEFEDIVVGDLIKLQCGNQVPVDVITLKYYGVSLSADESSITGESDFIEKCTLDDLYKSLRKKSTESIGTTCIEENKFVLLISGSTINEGTAYGLVVTTGENTYLRKQTKFVESGVTPLQEKLELIAWQISVFGSIAGILTVVVIWSKVLYAYFQFNQGGDELMSNLLEAVIVAVSVVVCAIPEGLPLAVSIALAYSVRKMMLDQNLVKKINCCETMGNADQICTDKTGTLTKNKMTVIEVFYANKNHQSFINLKGTFKSYLEYTILYDCSFNFRKDERGNTEITGSSTEIACANLYCELENYMINDSYDYNKLKKLVETPQKDSELIGQYPFNSKMKMSSSLVRHKNKYYLYIKGAPDYLISNNMLYVNESGIHALDDATYSKIKLQLSAYSDNCYRNLALCYYQVDFETHDEDGYLLKDPFKLINKDKIILYGIIAIEDPLRDTVTESISLCQQAGIRVRMITGDNPETAFAISKKCGILPAFTPKSQMNDYIISGSEFNRLTGGVREIYSGTGIETLPVDQWTIQHYDDALLEKHRLEAHQLLKEGNKLTKKHMVKNLAWFRDNYQHISVMARSQPADKFTLITGLMQLEHIVAVTGDGANDASALSMANVGFAMGKAGTQAAKEACDIVILDDNFTSIVKAVLWGRNIFDGVRKFLQFQLSVNVVAVVTALVSATFDSSSHSALTAVQLLWVNMIMDSLGALALATDEPSVRLLNRKPYHRREKIINPRMMVSVLVMGLFQTVVICIYLYYAHHFVPCYETEDKISNMVNCQANGLVQLNGDVHANALFDVTLDHSTQHYTVVFNLFIFLQVFNMINCRKIDSYQVFSGLFSNWVFLGVWSGIFIVQVVLGTYGGVFFSVYQYGMGTYQWVWVIGTGLMVLPVGLVTKWIIFYVFQMNDGENNLTDDDSKDGKKDYTEKY